MEHPTGRAGMLSWTVHVKRSVQVIGVHCVRDIKILKLIYVTSIIELSLLVI